MSMYVIIDNYDSFTHNLYQYLCELSGAPVEVFRNDRITVDELAAMEPAGIVISPGPGRPEEAGISVEVIRRFAGTIPILGVCLGHQAIGYAFGGKVVPARRIVHGKTDDISLDGRGLFRGLPRTAKFTRYHSLALEAESLPAELEVTARAADGEIMGVRHREHLVEGIQFHPESIASEHGKRCLQNFLTYRREPFPLSSILAGLQKSRGITREEAEAFMDELTDGRLTDAQIAGVLAALSGSLIGAGGAGGFRHGAAAQEAAVCERPQGAGHLRHGRRRSCHVQHLLPCGDRRRLLRRARCKARQPRRQLSLGSAEFFRALGVPVDVPGSGKRGAAAGHGLLLPLRAPLPRRHAPRGAGAQRAGRPQRDESRRPALQSRGRLLSAHRRV